MPLVSGSDNLLFYSFLEISSAQLAQALLNDKPLTLHRLLRECYLRKVIHPN